MDGLRKMFYFQRKHAVLLLYLSVGICLTSCSSSLLADFLTVFWKVVSYCYKMLHLRCCRGPNIPRVLNMRQGYTRFSTKCSIMTQGPTADPKCKLIISSFLTLPHLLDCLVCTRNAMLIVLLLQMMEGWDKDREWVSSYSLFFFLCFCILLSHVLSPFI